MIETLLAGGKSGRFFPDSGPGTKVLVAGTKDYGYFGEVTEAQMGLNDGFNQLLDQTNASARSIGAVTNIWFKFVLNGKFLFFPKLPLAGLMPLKDLYAMRAVIDADDPLRYSTDITTGQPIYQQNLHVANSISELFKVRSLDTIPNAAQSANVTNSLTPPADSEIAMLLMALLTSSPHPDTLKIKKYVWSDFTNFGGNSYTSFFTQDIGPTSNPLQSTFTPQALTRNWVAATSTQAWRPLLQYIPAIDRAGLLLLPDNLVVSNEDMPEQVVIEGVASADLTAMSYFTNVVETQQVAPSGSSDVTVYALAPMGGIATTENEVAGITATTDQGQHLYEIDGVTQSEYSGYFTV